MSIAWNIVNNTGEAFDFVADAVERKVEKIESILSLFPGDAYHLQVVLDAEAKRKTYRVALNLHLPSHILHVEKESKSLRGALDGAVKSLLGRLERTKSKRRGEHLLRHARHHHEVAHEPAATLDN